MRDGRPAFPNARVHMTAGEWAFLRGQAPQAALVAAIRPRVSTFAPGATLAPGIRAVEIAGHTPGHTGVEIASRGQRLLAVGDMAPDDTPRLAKRRGTPPSWAALSRFELDADVTYSVSAGRRGDEEADAEGVRRELP